MDFLRYLAQVMDVHPSLLLPITMAKRDRITRLGRAIDHVNVNKDNNVKNKDNYDNSYSTLTISLNMSHCMTKISIFLLA